MVDSTMFRIFDFKLIQGNRVDPFPTSNSVIITPKIAKNILAMLTRWVKVLRYSWEIQKQLFTIAGIAAQAPEESSIKYDILIPYSNDKLIFSERMLHTWFNIFNETYVLLRKDVSVAGLEKIPTHA